MGKHKIIISWELSIRSRIIHIDPDDDSTMESIENDMKDLDNNETKRMLKEKFDTDTLGVHMKGAGAHVSKELGDAVLKTFVDEIFKDGYCKNPKSLISVGRG